MARNIVLQCLKVPQISAPIQNCLMLLGLDKWDKTLQLDACGFLHVLFTFLFPKQCGNTWGSYGSSKKPGCPDRGAGHMARGIHRYFCGFVLACSFRLWIFVVSAWRRPAPAGFVCKFS